MSIPHVTFFDTARLYYSSYFINGLLELASNGQLTLEVSNRLPRDLGAVLQSEQSRQSLFALSVFRLRHEGREQFFCIDAHDANQLQAAHGMHGYHLPLLRFVSSYFKVNYNPASIRSTPELEEHASRIKPVSQFMPLRPLVPATFLRRLLWPPAVINLRPPLGHNQPYAGYLMDAKRRIRDIRNFESLASCKAHRNAAKDIDIFFVTGFHRGVEHAATMQHRYELMRRLARIEGLNVQTGFANYAGLPEDYLQFVQPRLKQHEYMDALSRAKVVIYTQGIERCISSKFCLAMAMGSVMVGEALENNPELVHSNPHLQEQFGFDDPGEIAGRAIALCGKQDDLRRLAQLNADMFDRDMAPAATAAYLLERVPV